MNYVNELITSLLIDSLLYKNLLFDDPIRWSICLLTTGRSVCQLSTCGCLCLSVCLFVCLLMSRCLLMSVYLCVCVSICVFCLSVCLAVVCLAVGRSICLPFSRSVCLWSICLCACLRASVCLYLSVYLSVSLSLCLSICLLSVGRSVVSLSELSVSHSVHEACRQRRGGCWERERKATHTRATDWADECWAKDGAESRDWEQEAESGGGCI